MQQIACVPQADQPTPPLFCVKRQFNNFLVLLPPCCKFVEGSSYRAFGLRSNMQLVNIHFHWQPSTELNKILNCTILCLCHWSLPLRFTEPGAELQKCSLRSLHIFGIFSVLTHKYLKCFDAFYIFISHLYLWWFCSEQFNYSGFWKFST